MKVIIAGSRHFGWDAEPTIIEALKSLNSTPTEVVYGGANGVDTIGAKWATENGIRTRLFSPDWNTHGRAAGPIRNKEMAEYADALVLVWDGKSRGSASMKREAEKRGLLIIERIIERRDDEA